MGMLTDIGRLIYALPTKDIELANKFIRERNFEFLQDLVNSAVYKVKRAKTIGDVSSPLMSVDIDNLLSLKSTVDIYCMRLGIYDPEK
jgi:hypothetical protein